MTEMTSHERFARMFQHRPADRVPIIDAPWSTTIERWRREGLPEGVDWADFFGTDKVAHISLDNSPRYEEKVLAEDDRSRTVTTRWGATLRRWTHAGGTPEFLDFVIKDRASWELAKARMTPSRDRIDWDALARDYKQWRAEGRWIIADLWFGFDVTHAWTIGTEPLLYALVDDPQWCVDMFQHFLSVNLTLLEMVWDAGYRFDSVFWYDDLGFKHNQFMSVKMYRELLKPAHKRACDWAHARGVHTHLHSCGDVNPFVPEFIEIGLDALNPLEVKAGMDPVALKREYGKYLVFHGGINAVLWNDPAAIEAEIGRVVPAMKQAGGYIFASDHSVPDTVSLATFRRIVDLAKQAGAY